AQAHGKAKSIGVSNFSIDQLKLILEHGKVPPAVNQIRFHPYDYHGQAELLEFADKHGIRIESYSGPITKAPGGSLDGIVEGITKRLGLNVTLAQVLMSWIRAKGVVIITHVASSCNRIQQVADNIQGLHRVKNEFRNTWPHSNCEDVAAIDETGRHPPSNYNPQPDIYLHKKFLLGLMRR
ncbi:hypothetical protein RSAG8_07712, partial [Rhizoctonia solani AG-8 WAC10335]